MTTKLLPVKLEYSSPEKRKEYRGAAGTAMPSSEITYQEVAVDTLTGKTGGKVQKRLQGRIALVPDFDPKGQVTVKALIDRMKIVVRLDTLSNTNTVRSAIDAVLKPNTTHVEALNAPHVHGHSDVFAITMQEPTPDVIAKVYGVLLNTLRVVEHVISLIELSLDFWPRKHLAEDEKVHFRERVVGLLQRHHWCELPGDINAGTDARQVYLRDPNGKKEAVTSFLFPVKGSGGRNKPDNDVCEKSVQGRLSRPQLPNGLFLDATVYKGDQKDEHFGRRDSAGFTIRIQHKVTDKSNPVTGNIDPLGDDKKRARIEVTVSARRLESDFGVVTLADLAGFDFRQIRNRYLQFWHPTADPNIDEIKIMRTEMPKRGIYAVELRQRVLAVSSAAATKLSVTKEGHRLAWSEMNNRVGDALDALRKQWGTLKVRV